jgi:hypothetical protein
MRPMKTSRTLIPVATVCALGVVLFVTGCSKKSGEPPATTTMPPKAAPSEPSSASTAAAPAANTPADMLKAAADEAAAEAKKQTGDATTTMAAELQQKAGSAPAAMADATKEAGQAAGSSLDALKQQADQLLTQYSGELATLKTGAAKLKELIDKNAAMLPAGVNAKYQELNALLPQLSGMVDKLKNYQSADLATLVPKLKEDFGTAQKLYAEVKGMLPAM